jgi:hypothetical protein
MRILTPHDEDNLEERLLNAWFGKQPSVICEADDQWRKQLTACVKVNRGHLKRLL